MYNASIEFEISECYFCNKKVKFYLEHWCNWTDYGYEYDSNASIVCVDENCFLNRFQELQEDCQEWEVNCGGYKTDEYLKKHIIKEYSAFKNKMLVEKLVEHIGYLEKQIEGIQLKDQVLDYND